MLLTKFASTSDELRHELYNPVYFSQNCSSVNNLQRIKKKLVCTTTYYICEISKRLHNGKDEIFSAIYITLVFSTFKDWSLINNYCHSATIQACIVSNKKQTKNQLAPFHPSMKAVTNERAVNMTLQHKMEIKLVF